MYKEIMKTYEEENDGFNGSYYGYVVSTKEENLKNWLQKEINDDGYVYNLIKESTDEIFILKNINIEEDFQGKGHGSQILAEAMEESDAPTILICDIGENQRDFFKLEDFYASQGFENILTTNNYPLMASEDIGFELREKLLPFQDKVYVKEWINASSFEEMNFKTQKEPLNQFLKQIKDMKEYGDEEDEERVEKIKDKIQKGEKPWPIYVDNKHDDFVMEGRHKMVAFYELGIEEIDVCRVSIKEKPELQKRKKIRP